MKSKSILLLFLVGIPALTWLVFAARNHESGTPGRKIVGYQDSMHPWIKSDQPGKCTICAMDLTPLYEGDSGFGSDGNLVALSSNSITVLNVQSEEVHRQVLSRSLAVAGTLEAIEARRALVSAPAPGRIQMLAVDFTGAEAQAGQPLVTILSAELIQKRVYIRAANVSLPNDSIEKTPGGGRADPFSSQLLAPISGTVIERLAVPGKYVLEGEKLLTIVDPSVHWFRFDVYERQLPWLQVGQKIEVMVPAAPDKVFPATISFIEPSITEPARTVKVRAEIDNPVGTSHGPLQRLLRFGMYAEGRVRAAAENVMAVPRSAILFPGGAAYAYVEKRGGAFERRRVKLGRQGDELWEVLEGLEEGDRVVTAGNVLMDAQAQFNRGSDSGPAMSEPAMADSGNHQTITAAGGEVSHGIETTADAGDGLTPAHLTSLREFLNVTDGFSRALAADSLEQLQVHLKKLPDAASFLGKAFGAKHPWQAVLQRIEATSRWGEPADLAAARKAFLPFSTNVVELVQQARDRETLLRLLKVYHCPMAPKPGLWFQAHGPLRNPFYSAKMLTCGEEVRPATIAVQAASKPEVTPHSGAMASAPRPIPQPAARSVGRLPSVTGRRPIQLRWWLQTAARLPCRPRRALWSWSIICLCPLRRRWADRQPAACACAVPRCWAPTQMGICWFSAHSIPSVLLVAVLPPTRTG